MRVLYSFGILLYGLVIRLASLWNEKAKLWVNGRKNILSKISKDFMAIEARVIWIHSASLGEFEQARPLIEALKQKNPELKIVLTFFSPSGYEIRKNYPLADFVYYLPEDSTSNARQLISLIKPKIAVFIKYEYWYNYMNELNNSSIPLIFISGIFRANQPFFRFYGGWFLNHLKHASHFFVQNRESVELLNKVGITNVSKSGDTRFDRVVDIATQVSANNILEKFKNNQTLFLAGSSWLPDETLVKGLHETQLDLKIVLAPHQIDENHLLKIEKLFTQSIRYSAASGEEIQDFRVLIIDNMGMLSSLYQYADIAMIGGGFGVGIHNTLEAATFGMPIIIGPNYQKFQEAKDLLDLKVISVIENSDDLIAQVSHLINNPQQIEDLSAISKEYVNTHTGATQMILEFIDAHL